MSRLIVLACHRCNLARATRLPEGAQLVNLPCTGRVSLPLVLTGLCQGVDGVLVLGRHEASCRFNGAERLVRERIQRLSQLLELLGLGAERVRFVMPSPGADGPSAAVEQMLAELEALGPTPLAAIAPRELVSEEGLDTAWALVRWLATQPSLRPAPEPWGTRAGLRVAAPGAPGLLAAELLGASLLGGDLLRPLDAIELFKAALEILDALGAPGVALSFRAEDLSACYCLGEESAPQAMKLDRLLLERASAWPRLSAPVKIACDGSAEHVQLLEALGYTPLDVGQDPLPANFAYGPELRRRADARLEAAASAGAQALLVGSPRALVHWSLLTREGSWRTSLLRPVLGMELAARCQRQEVIP